VLRSYLKLVPSLHEVCHTGRRLAKRLFHSQAWHGRCRPPLILHLVVCCSWIESHGPRQVRDVAGAGFDPDPLRAWKDRGTWPRLGRQSRSAESRISRHTTGTSLRMPRVRHPAQIRSHNRHVIAPGKSAHRYLAFRQGEEPVCPSSYSERNREPYVHLSRLGLQLHFAIQARHRTCGPFPFKKGTAAIAFRECGSECGLVAMNLIL
jgi:hypothetical protein